MFHEIHLAAVPVVLAIVALRVWIGSTNRRDRARGTYRCLACQYDLSGTPRYSTVCSECGGALSVDGVIRSASDRRVRPRVWIGLALLVALAWPALTLGYVARWAPPVATVHVRERVMAIRDAPTGAGTVRLTRTDEYRGHRMTRGRMIDPVGGTSLPNELLAVRYEVSTTRGDVDPLRFERAGVDEDAVFAWVRGVSSDPTTEEVISFGGGLLGHMGVEDRTPAPFDLTLMTHNGQEVRSFAQVVGVARLGEVSWHLTTWIHAHNTLMLLIACLGPGALPWMLARWWHLRAIRDTRAWRSHDETIGGDV